MRAPWLESHETFNGVGAHELNPRYDHVDDVRSEFDHIIQFNFRELHQRHGLLSAAGVRLDGIDVSHHNSDAGPLNWMTVGSIPTVWGACKATQSTTYVDPTLPFHRSGMSAAGLKYRGLYHWLSSSTDPVAQARFFLKTIGMLQPGEFAMLDAEEAGITQIGCRVWCETVEAVTGRPVVVYSGAFTSGGTIWRSGALRSSTLGRRPFTLAAYVTEARALNLPGVKDFPWEVWQFSSDGPVSGVTGRCDMNRFDDINQTYILACGLYIPAPPTPLPPPVDVDPTPLSTLGGTMFIVVGNLDDQTNPKRWAWNGLVKRDLRNAEEHARLVAGGFYRQGVKADGFTYDDLSHPTWMSAVDLDTYATV